MTRPRPSTVLQLVTRRQLRGAEVFAGELSTRLSSEGTRVILAGLFPPGEPPLDPPGVPVRDLFHSTPRGVSHRLVRKLARLLDDLRPEIVQANGSATLKYSVLARRRARSPVILIYRNISVASHWLRTPLHRLWNRWLLRQTDHIVAVSEHSRADLLDTYGLDAGKITVLSRGVETRGLPAVDAPRETLARLCGLPATDPLLVHVGSFTEEKNHRGLLEVLTLLHRHLPETRLALFGDGPLRPRIEEEARSTGLASHVAFLGARPEALDLAAGADLLVLFSSVEGMPGVVLEAGARRLAVVATDVGGVAEVIEHGESGLLVPAGDTAACARAILLLLKDPEKRLRVGQALRTTVANRYDVETVVAGYRDLYRRLLESGRWR